MRFVYDNQIELRICDGIADVVLPREIYGGDQLGLPMPDVFLRMRIDIGTRDMREILLKPIFHLVYPLCDEMSGDDNQDALRLIAEFELLRDEPCHYRLACTRVIGDEESDALLFQHAPHRFDLMRQRFYFGDANCQRGSIAGGVSVTFRLKAEESVARLCCPIQLRRGDFQRCRFFGSELLVDYALRIHQRSDNPHIPIGKRVIGDDFNPFWPEFGFNDCSEGYHYFLHCKRKLFSTTETLLNAIANAASIGCSSRSIIGRKVSG